MTMTIAHLVTATNLTAGTATAAEMPLFSEGEQVFNLDDVAETGIIDVVDGNGKAPKSGYTVLPTASGGAGFYGQVASGAPADQTNVAVVAGASRVFRGFQHTTVPAATVGANTNSVAWAYDLKRNYDGVIVRNVHQVKLTTKTHWETYIDTRNQIT